MQQKVDIFASFKCMEIAASTSEKKKKKKTLAHHTILGS